jgi:hypothetical protein
MTKVLTGWNDLDKGKYPFNKMIKAIDTLLKIADKNLGQDYDDDDDDDDDDDGNTQQPATIIASINEDNVPIVSMNCNGAFKVTTDLIPEFTQDVLSIADKMWFYNVDPANQVLQVVVSFKSL